LRVLVVNAGSSSLKLRLLDANDEVLAADDLPTHHGRIDADAVARAVSGMPAPDAVGHRIVHGGERFTGPVVIDAEVEAGLRDLTDLAPLHQPKSLAALDAVGSVLPETPAVACFDTAFHATLPAAAATYALPAAWRARFGLRRYGFHGLSHAYASRRAAEMLGRKDLSLVSCHLGAGASLAAVRDGRSIDTTMGFTPLDGLVMATRSGSIDPGLLLWLIEHESMSAGELAEALEHSSGLLAIAGTADMREVLARAERGDAAAGLALDVYVHRLRSLIAAMAASLGGLDALLFTGGVGERSAQIRGLAAAGLAFLGVQLDENQNTAATGDVEVSGRGDRVSVLVVEAREDVEIAKQVRALLGDAQARPGPRRS
jgi:acetate kinase